jgi:hypothetical protein
MRSYAGKGILSFPGITDIKGSFKLTFNENGKVALVFTPEGSVPNEILNFSVDAGRFSGESVNSDYHVQIDKIYLSKIHLGGTGDSRIELLIFHPVKIGYQPLQSNDRIELIRGFSNLLFWGTEITRRDDTFSRDIVKVTLDGKEARLVQLQDFEQIAEHLKEYKDVRTTSEFKVEGYCRELNYLRELSESVQFLCSLASRNYVTAIYEDIYNKNKDVLSETTLYPLKTYPYSTQIPLIDTSLHGVKDFKDYLECTYSRYEQFKTPLRLHYVIELFITSEIYSPMELQYLLTTTSLECLERHFRTWKNLPPLRGINSKTERLLDFFKVPYNRSETAFNQIRNSIVHEGRFPQSVDGFKSLLELRNLLDRLFLVILGYKGKHYYNVVSRKKELL